MRTKAVLVRKRAGCENPRDPNLSEPPVPGSVPGVRIPLAVPVINNQSSVE